MKSSALISRCGHYRYWLKREWDDQRPPCVFVGLNPSTADAQRDDPTLRRCIGFAQDWGFGGLTLVNLFAFRATDPAVLKKVQDPIGPRTDYWLRRICGETADIIAAWGNMGAMAQLGARPVRRDQWFERRFGPLLCLGTTQSGAPRHPLYVPKHQVMMPYHPSEQT